MIKRIFFNYNIWSILFIGIFIFLHDGSFQEYTVYAGGEEEIIKKDSDMIPFYWMVSIVGGCIAITLSYVGWRKYKGEEKKEMKKDKTVD